MTASFSEYLQLFDGRFPSLEAVTIHVKEIEPVGRNREKAVSIILTWEEREKTAIDGHLCLF